MPNEIPNENTLPHETDYGLVDVLDPRNKGLLDDLALIPVERKQGNTVPQNRSLGSNKASEPHQPYR